MTRGYVCIVNGNNIENVAYLQSDAYLSGYGLTILKEIQKGYDTFPKWLKEQRMCNIECYGKKNDPCEDFALNWIKPDQKTRYYKDWNYSEYGYIYNAKSENLKVYHYGSLLLNIKRDAIEIDKYIYLFKYEDEIYDSISYDSEKLANTINFEKAMKNASKLSEEELHMLVEKNEEKLYLDDYHSIAVGHYKNHETYSKILRSSDKNKYELEFIVQHDANLYRDYGWEVLLQAPYIRFRLVKGPKYGNFSSEKAAVNALRSYIKTIGSQKLLRTAEIFERYKLALENEKDSEGSLSAFLDTLQSEWDKEPWLLSSNCNVEALRREGNNYLYLLKKRKEQEETTSK